MTLKGLGRLAVVAALAPGCGLTLDFDPPDGNLYRCTARVQNGAMTIEVSTAAGEFASDGFFTCTAGPCPTDCGRSATADVERDFRLWLPSRIGEAASDPASLFAMHAGPWCVEEGSLRCEPEEAHVAAPVCPAVHTAPLPECPALPAGDPCLEVACPGVPCDRLLFGALPVGETVAETVTLTNCGPVPIQVGVDGVVEPLPRLADFVVPAATNACRPSPAEVVLPLAGDRCTFDIVFQPTTPGDHRGRTVFRSDANPAHEILVDGDGVGGSLVVTVPGLPDPSAIPDPLCFDALSGGCTATRTIRLENSGPGALTVLEVRVDRAPGNFQVVAPPPPPLPITLAPGGPPLDVQVRWCDPAPGRTSGTLVIETDDPARPTVMIELTRLATGACPAGS